MVPVLDKTGEWTASLIQRYVMYIAALPLVSSYCGLTSSMFAVESLAFNAYWLYLAHQFRQKRSNRNAQRVFRASLWYLPLMLTLMVYHSRNWDNSESREAELLNGAVDGSRVAAVGEVSEADRPDRLTRSDEMGEQIERGLIALRRGLSSVCPHEQLAIGDSVPQYCPPTIMDRSLKIQDAAVLANAHPTPQQQDPDKIEKEHQ